MEHKARNRMLRCVGAGTLLSLILFIPACTQKRSVRAASTPAPKPDPLLGKWVMIADNGGGGNGTIADFRSDGTVVFTQKGKQHTVHYKREPGKQWVDRRTSGADKQELGAVLDQFRKPGVEMIEFPGPDGKFLDYGGTLLTLDPDRRVLFNILTQLWCRPGEEARAKAEFK